MVAVQMAQPQHLAPLLTALAILLAMPAAALEADYVIVGGGTAGCALAARICTALPDSSVALLERSQPRTASEELLVRAAGSTYLSWNERGITETFNSAPNPGLGNRTIDILTGNTLGGSSSINAAQFTMPPLETVEAWGIQGLTADRAKELYAKAARQLGAAVPAKPLQHTYTPEYFAAAAAAGVTGIEAPEAASVGAPEADTLWVNRVAVDPQGRRVDSCTGYLQPAMRSACSDNLTLLQGVTVTKLLLEQDRAVGVEFLQAAQQDSTASAGSETASAWSKTAQNITALREVICSAGPYASPKLLQLSGIGPAALLANHSIPLVQDLPVGVASQGRPALIAISLYLGKPIAPENDPAQLSSRAARVKFTAGQGGVLGIAAVMANGVLADENAYLLMSDKLPASPDLLGQPGIYSACFYYPTSFGSVAISSSDSFATPDVALDLLGSEDDAAIVTVCLNRMRAVNAAFPEQFQMREIVPGVMGTASADVARQTAGYAQHFVGGCAVGTVLEADLRVKGFQNLRVVDASAIPEIPRFAGPSALSLLLQ